MNHLMDDHKTILADKFLRDELSPEERISWEKIKNDKDVSDYIKDIQETISVLKNEENEALRSALIDEERQMNSKKSFKNYILPILIVLGLLIAGLVIWKVLFSKNLGEEIYAEVYKTYPNVIDPLTKGESSSISGYQYYEMGEYEKAIDQLSEMDENQDAIFYLGLSYLGIERYQDAQNTFEQLLSSEKYVNSAEWYAGLACLQLQPHRECTTWFERLANKDSGRLKSRARSVLQKIK